MKRLSILFFALTMVLGQVAAKSSNGVQEEPDSITAQLNYLKDLVTMQAKMLVSSEEQAQGVIKAVDHLIALKNAPADPEVGSVADEVKVDSVEYYTNLIDSLNRRIDGAERSRIEGYETLYLKLVYDFITDEDYSEEGLKNAQNLVARVRYNEDVLDFKYLTDNYYDWLYEIAQICANAQKDLQANKQPWKNEVQNRAAHFIEKLDNCGYMIRKNKEDWWITYLDNCVAKAKQRILKYRSNPVVRYDDFKGILPDEFLPKPKKKGNSINGDQPEQNPSKGEQMLSGFQGSKANADEVNDGEETDTSNANEGAESSESTSQDFKQNALPTLLNK